MRPFRRPRAIIERSAKVPRPGGRREMTTVSVIIPALNEERHIGLLLSDIERQSRRPEEVIVVDAGSGDGTVAIVEGFPGAVLLRGEPPVARGRTLGGMSATGDVLV